MALSIITVVKNSGDTLLRCINSVAQQKNIAFEHLVVDGASTDGTLEIIEKCSDKLAWWVSEPDKGIAQAMNKAIGHAQGEWVLFLGADDYLPDERCLARALPFFQYDENDLCWFDVWFGSSKMKRKRVSPRKFNAWTRFKMPGIHQGLLCRRRLFEQFGGFDESYMIAMDYEWVLRLYLKNLEVSYVPKILAVMDDQGVSSQRDWKAVKQRLNEEHEIHQHHADGPISWVYAIWHPAYFLYRRFKAIALG